MALPTKDFFLNNEVLFLGYSRNQKAFSHMVFKGLEKAGINVVPVNINKSDEYDVDVHNEISDLEKIPETAYILLNEENTKKAFNSIKDKGIKKILFHNKHTVSGDILDECKKAGIETETMCPLMMIGSGIHGIHRFFAGIGK